MVVVAVRAEPGEADIAWRQADLSVTHVTPCAPDRAHPLAGHPDKEPVTEAGQFGQRRRERGGTRRAGGARPVVGRLIRHQGSDKLRERPRHPVRGDGGAAEGLVKEPRIVVDLSELRSQAIQRHPHFDRVLHRRQDL